MLFRILLISFLCLSCTSDNSPLARLFTFPKSLSEVSAIESRNGEAIWCLQDSGNEAALYQLDKAGNIAHTVTIDNAPNKDWEALAADEEGNLYIGDFGNNNNERRVLVIYKADAASLQGRQASVSRRIAFWYPEQNAFPPKKKQRVFDSEAFFYHKGNFYLFTKNRSSSFDGTTTLYRVPNRDGRHPAERIGTFRACDVYKQCAVTAADISPDGSTVALLTATKVYLFRNFTGDDFFSGDVREIDLNHFSQKEGLCFVSNSQLYIADERDKKTGGFLYLLNL